MAITIKFDSAGVPQIPTFVLATRSGVKIGEIATGDEFVITDNMNTASEFTMTVYKYFNDVECAVWKDIKPLRLVWCREWDKWFQIDIDLEESDDTVKHITAKSLAESELSQINLYNMEINTETDILTDDYVVTKFYNPDNVKGSLLHRMLSEKAPHYRIKHVDDTLCNIQRSFSFDDKSIYGCFNEVAEEIECLFVYDNGSDEDGNPDRTISAYDLLNMCENDSCSYYKMYNARYRGSEDYCPKCGSAYKKIGYGDDTTIFVSNDNLTDDITKTPGTDSIKNCFRLVAGDDLMTATVINCNPNGSQYIWNLSEEDRSEMTQELQDALSSYDEAYEAYQMTRDYDIGVVTAYNALVTKYNDLISSREVAADVDSYDTISTPVTGYSNLMLAYYNVLDFYMFVHDSVMPTSTYTPPTLDEQVEMIEEYDGSTVAVSLLTTGTSSLTVESAIKLLMRTIIDTAAFSYEITTEEWNNQVSERGTSTWKGSIKITLLDTSGLDPEDPTSATVEIARFVVNDDYETYTKQLVDKKLAANDADDYSLSALFKIEDISDFSERVRLYSSSELDNIYDICQGCLDILIENGCDEASSTTFQLYERYLKRLRAIQQIQTEMEESITTITTLRDDIDSVFNTSKSTLNFEDWINAAGEACGKELWKELCAYRREDEYQNDNYISDGLDNDELFANALQFYDTAREELLTASTVQHTIDTDLNNLLVIPGFEKIREYFKVGNWIRVEIDGEVYKLRLTSYKIDFDNLDTIDVEFSDAKLTPTGMNDIGSLMANMSSISTSYDAVYHQVENNSKSSAYVNDWVNNSMNITNTQIVSSTDEQEQTWDEHGILIRRKDPITDSYDDQQMKIVNKGLYITDDDWDTIKAAIGRYIYQNEDGDNVIAYGLLADTIVGKMILGEALNISNTGGSVKFDENGLVVTTKDTSGETKVTKITTDGSGDAITIDGTSLTDYIATQSESQIQSINTQYCTIQSDTVVPDSTYTWTYEQPSSIDTGSYVWQRNEIEFSSGDVAHTSPILAQTINKTLRNTSTQYVSNISNVTLPYYIGDMLVMTNTDGNNVIYRCINDSGSSVSIDDWEEVLLYFDDTAIQQSLKENSDKIDAVNSSYSWINEQMTYGYNEDEGKNVLSISGNKEDESGSQEEVGSVNISYNELWFNINKQKRVAYIKGEDDNQAIFYIPDGQFTDTLVLGAENGDYLFGFQPDHVSGHLRFGKINNE